MRNKKIDFPHPVLNEYSKDFVNSDFSMTVTSVDDSDDSISILVKCELKGDGLTAMMNNGLLSGVARVICSKTSYRDIFPISLNDESEIKISKDKIAGSFEIQGIILANDYGIKYSLQDFNQLYFANFSFDLRKGDIVASEPGVTVKLDTLLEKEAAGIVFISRDINRTDIKVNYATINEQDEKLMDYIVIIMPEREYNNYNKLRTKKHLKSSIDRFLQSSIILPAIVEGIGRLRREEELKMSDENYIEEYAGTVWAESLLNAIRNKGYEDLTDSINHISDYELANKILKDVVNDSINNMMQKMDDWSMLIVEDEVL